MILVSLVCCYAACWGPTKTRGVQDVANYRFRGLILLENHVKVIDDNKHKLRHSDATALCPLIVSIDERPTRKRIFGNSRGFYFWFFGYVVKLPYERELDDIRVQID